MRTRKTGFPDERFAPLVYKITRTYRECYPDGKSTICTLLSNTYYQKTFRASTAPTESGGTWTFTNCDGSTHTLSPQFGGGTISVHPSNVDVLVEYC